MGMIVGGRTQMVTVITRHDIVAAAPLPSAPSPGGKGHDAVTLPRSTATTTIGPTPGEALPERRKAMTMAAVQVAAVHLEAVVDAYGMADALWMTLAMMFWGVTAATMMPGAMMATLTGLTVLLMAG